MEKSKKVAGPHSFWAIFDTRERRRFFLQYTYHAMVSIPFFSLKKPGVISYYGNKTGFTLLELLIVISIVGILLLTLYPTFQKSQVRARDARRIQDLNSIKQALELYKQDNGKYPPGNVADMSCDSSVGAGGTCGGPGGWCPCSATDWSASGDILGALVPKYISKLPKDPINNDIRYYYYEVVCNEPGSTNPSSCTYNQDCTANGCCAYQLGVWLEDGTTVSAPYSGTPYITCNP